MKTLLIILVVLSVIALIPVGVDGGYNSKGLSLYLRIGIINIRAIPPGFFVSGVTNRKPKTKKPKPPKAALTEKHKKPKKPKPSREEIFALIKLVLKALSRFRHKLTVDYLRLHFTAASGDPFSTAMSYGAANAALSAAIPPPAALCRRGCRCVLTLPQRFSWIVAQDFSFVNTFFDKSGHFFDRSCDIVGKRGFCLAEGWGFIV